MSSPKIRSSSPFDAFMDKALALAERGRWSVCPNPVVGAVLVREGRIVARGFHRAFGRPHAEAECLRDAARKGIAPEGCTLVVTLEPCLHHGKTPPCAHAVLEAGIRRVVTGLSDPNPQAGGGAAWLRERGVDVITGVREDACRDAAADFLVWQREKRPYVILKMAATLDGRIAARAGGRPGSRIQWISGEQSRAAVHRLRADIGGSGGAVLIGGNTLYADDPLLTARPAGKAPSRPLACIVTSRLPSPGTLNILRREPGRSVFFCRREVAESAAADALRAAGIHVHGLDAAPAREGIGEGLDLAAGLRLLRDKHVCHYVLCEGGGKLALSLLERGLADEFRLHLSPRVLGDNAAPPLFDGRAPLGMEEALNMRICSLSMCGGDAHITLRPEPLQE
jgi:diaminohydroxyphosphoribosylaminopyrimidine deaminase/5-amino-6-(5-phosphoribosylamino)uracil reductase